MTRALVAVLIVLGGVGCKKGASSLQLTVDSDGTVHAVDHLRVVVTNGGMTSQPLVFPLTGAPVDLPPAQTLTLLFGADRRGPVDLLVDARDAGDTSLASQTAHTTITPGQAAMLTVTLPASPLPPSYTVTGSVSGLGGSVSSGAGFDVEGVIGMPGPRVVSSNGAITVEPLIPRSSP